MLKDDALQIISYAIEAAKPDKALPKYLKDIHLNDGKLIVIAVGKAAWLMAKSASEHLNKKIDTGLVITKYQHSLGPIEGFEICEAGHPVLDENSILATQKALSITENLSSNDDVIFLLSGGGSALFEKPLIPLQQLQQITQKLLNSGADIVEINTIRKRLSQVKGGKFGQWCKPAHIHNYILSDVISDQVDMIASGPTAIDSSSTLQAISINNKYQLNIPESIISQAIISDLDNVTTTIIGSVNQLCLSAKEMCEQLGYHSTIMDTHNERNDLEFAQLLSDLVIRYQSATTSQAYIFGGETTVIIQGNGKGGRNQETAFACISALNNTNTSAIISVGSDGTDGPTDAAGGYADSTSLQRAKAKNIDINSYLKNNDSYHGLQQLDDLIITGPTNTNVNDLTVVLVKR